MGFAPFMVAKSDSVVDNMKSQVFAGKAFPQDESGNISFAVSVGIGRGATRLILPVEEVADVNAVIRAFNPSVAAEDYSPADVVARTLRVQPAEDGGEAHVTFQFSYKPHSRIVQVPVREWNAFVSFMGDVQGWSEEAIAHYKAAQG
jgi:hypothetical protein